jgi:hypothetical protein
MRRSFLIAAGVGIAGFALFRARPRSVAASMMDMGSSGMMNSDPDMRTVMDLFANHGSIRRTVEELPNGIRSTTESDDLHVASLLQAHVASMYKRVDDRRLFSMMSRTLPTLFRNASRYRREAHYIPKGVVVVETSTDAKLIQVIRAHAREIDAFVRDGMPAMMDG